MLILPCYARRRGLGLSDIHDRCEIVNNGLLKVATKNSHLGGLRHLENPVLSVCIRTATQAQRDHKIIHARNFRVQPQAIMGSGIVE